MPRHSREMWAQLRTAYLQGSSLRRLAESSGVPLDTITKRSLREKWEAERQRIASEAAARVADEIIVRLADVRQLRMRAGRGILKRVCELVDSGSKLKPGPLNALAQAIDRALPANLAVPEGPEDGEDADLIVLEADDGSVWDETAGRQVPDALAAQPRGSGRVLRKPK